MEENRTDSISTPKVRKTLGLTGVTINAMALTAPGAFIWLLFQSQAVSDQTGLRGIWPGVALALLSCLLSALSFGELVRKFPESGFRSAYHFAERVFVSQFPARGSARTRLVKAVTGWAAHLYYWTYPGVVLAFMGTLLDTLLRQFGYHPTLFGELILTLSLTAFAAFLALRGITGSITSSIVLNTIQLVTLLAFSFMAILYRVLNPLGLSAQDWTYPSAASVLIPPNLSGLVFQAGLAMMLMVGFEASSALRATARNPQRDVPRATVLGLVIQGAFTYILGYFALSLALNTPFAAGAPGGIGAAAVSRAPIGDLAVQLGDALLGGNGFSLMVFMALTVIISLLWATLMSMNNAVRISFSMALDAEMPDVLGFLNPRYATPYWAVVILSLVTGLLSSIGIVGGLPVMMGLILASSLGALVLYALLCGLTIYTYRDEPRCGRLRHEILPAAGLLVNACGAVAIPWIGIRAGGTPRLAVWIALGLGGVWLLIGLAYGMVRRRQAYGKS